MALPTLSWRLSNNYSISAAGASPTVAEVLAAMNTAITTEAAGSGLWMVSDYNSGNGTLELKRKGSPSGQLGTVRILFFGGSAPNAAALHTGVGTGVATTLYMGFCIDANTTGPTGSYATGSPYAGLLWSGGVPVIAPSNLTTASSPALFIFEADDVFGVHLAIQTSGNNAVVGRLMTDPSGTTSYWAGWGSGTNIVANTFRLTGYTTTASAPIVAAGASLGPRGAAYLPEGWRTICAVGCSSYGTAYPDIYGNIDLAVLDPVPIGVATPASSPVYNFYCFLRQIRFGAIAANKNVLVDVNNTVQAYHIGIGTNGTAAAGFWLDTQQ